MKILLKFLIWGLSAAILWKMGNEKYYGLSSDVAKLPRREVYPQYTDLKTGSTAYCVDDGSLYMYEESTDIWYEQ